MHAHVYSICLCIHFCYLAPDSAPEDSSDEDEDNEEVGGKSDGLPASFYTDPLKMVLCVRTDLKMKKGKMCAQCGHASVGAYKRCAKKMKRVVDRWNLDGAKKIAVKVSSEEQL